MTLKRAGLGFENLEDRVVLTASVGETAIDFAADVRPAEFYESWIELNSVAQTITRSPQTTDGAAGDLIGEQVEQKVETFDSDYGLSGDPDGASADGSIPTETLSLNFDKVHWRYWP